MRILKYELWALEDEVKVLLGEGLSGYIPLFVSVGIVLIALVLAVKLARRRARGPLRPLHRASVLIAFAVVIAITSIGWLFLRMLETTRRMNELSLTDLHWDFVRPWAKRVEQEEAALFVVAFAMLIACGLVATAALIARVRAGSRPSARRLVQWGAALVIAEIACAVAIGVIRRSDTLGVTCCGGDIVVCRRYLAEEAAEYLDAARIHIGVATVLGLLFLARSSWRRKSGDAMLPQSRPETACIALFIAGLTAFVATRAMAYDATHPIPARGPDVCPMSDVDADTLPFVPFASSLVDTPVVSLFPRGATMNGVAATDPSNLAQLLDNHQQLWKQVTGSGRPMPPVAISAPADARVRDLAPWLAATARAHRTEARIVVQLPPVSSPTRTLGPIARSPQCAGVAVRLDRLDDAIARDLTWGDLAISAVLSPPGE
jgi:hypothetical protein